MNARGISVFYGATTAAVALSEVRPPVGSSILVGRFDIVRPLRLLDLVILRAISIIGSVFDPEFIKRLERAKFLELLSARMLMPVMPGDEVVDYLPTQVVSDYLASEVSPPLDGIMYPSVQAGRKSERNVVLFHKSSLVEEPDLPAGTKVTSNLYFDTDEGPEDDFSVTEETPLAPGVQPDEDEYAMIGWGNAGQGSARPEDIREATLGLDPASVDVHFVKAVKVVTLRRRVRRPRLEAFDPKNALF